MCQKVEHVITVCVTHKSLECENYMQLILVSIMAGHIEQLTAFSYQYSPIPTVSILASLLFTLLKKTPILKTDKVKHLYNLFFIQNIVIKLSSEVYGLKSFYTLSFSFILL